jgi:succinyl-CoA synthetase beta subunit
MSTLPVPPFPPGPMQQGDPRSMAAAYMVRVHGTTPALFLDLGRALAYAAQHHGQLVPLVEQN